MTGPALRGRPPATRLNAWPAKVHAASIASGQGFTCGEAVARFGEPPAGSAPATKQLQHARARGWFVARPTGVAAQVRYYAVPAPEAPRRVETSPSYFDGLRRVRSVFELGQPDVRRRNSAPARGRAA